MRWTAGYWLSTLNRVPDEVHAGLLDTLRDSDPNVQATAIEALLWVDPIPVEALDTLVEISDRLGGLSSTRAKGIMYGFGTRDSIPAEASNVLLTLFHSVHPNIAMGATVGLTKIRPLPIKFTETLLAVIQDTDSERVLQAALALSRMPTVLAETYEELLVALHRSDRSARREIIQALGQLDPVPAKVLQALQTALQDPDVQLAAAIALGNSQLTVIPKEAVEIALAKLEELGEDNRETLVELPEILTLMGRRAEANERTIQALGGIIRHQPGSIGQESTQALVQLGHRFPSRRKAIVDFFLQIITEAELAKEHADLAFEGLWNFYSVDAT